MEIGTWEQRGKKFNDLLCHTEAPIFFRFYNSISFCKYCKTKRAKTMSRKFHNMKKFKNKL
jgi:hypothetical protein